MSSNRRALLPLAFLVLGLAGISSAQTADEIIEKHLTALGGREALAKLKSRKLTGTVTVSTAAGDLPGIIETYVKAPNSSRTYMKLDLSALGTEDLIVDQRFDGTRGYAMNTMQGDNEITGNQLENMRNNLFPSGLLNYKGTGTKVEVLPREKIGDMEAIVLAITPKTGSSTKVFLDGRTYLPVKFVAKMDNPQLGGAFEQITEISDYRNVDGVMVAFQLKSTNPAQTLAIRVNKIEHNTSFDESMFSKPAAKK